MNCNDCGGFLPRCDCSPFGGRRTRAPHRVIEEAHAEIMARQLSPEPHYLRPTQSSLFEPSPIPHPLPAQANDGGEHG